MTHYQAEILSVIVQTARYEGWRVPTGERLAQLLFENEISRRGRGLKKISARAANDHLRRLRVVEDCFEKRGNGWFIKPERLATEPQTVLLFLAADQIAATDSQGYISAEHLQRLYLFIQEKFNLQPAFEILFKFACDERYLEVLDTTPGCVRIGSRTKDQSHYFELIAPRLNINALINESGQFEL